MTDQELADLSLYVCERLRKTSFRLRELDESEMVGRVYIRLHEVRRKLNKHPNPTKSAMVVARYEFLKGLGYDKATEVRRKYESDYARQRGNMWEAVDDDPNQEQIDHQDELERLSRGLVPDMLDVMVGRHVLGFSGTEINQVQQKGSQWAGTTEYEAKKRMRFNLSCSDMFGDYLERWPDLRDGWKPRKKRFTDNHVDELTFGQALERAKQRWRSRR
jgi:hypothetical protein